MLTDIANLGQYLIALACVALLVCGAYFMADLALGGVLPGAVENASAARDACRDLGPYASC